MRTLTHEEARAFYDWLGARQDSQRYYEDVALAELVAHGAFDEARAVFEFGSGTGRFADHLLSTRLPAGCRYEAVDSSATMVRLARARLARWGERAQVTQTSGAMRLPASDGGFDRFVACYVLDLLSDADIRQLLAEAHRILVPGGLLCIAGLTRGASWPARIVGWLWHALFRLHPRLVGGCRALVVRDYLDDRGWSIRHSGVVTRFGVSTEVLVAAAKRSGTRSAE